MLFSSSPASSNYYDCYAAAAVIAIWLHTLRYHINIFNKFYWSLFFPRAMSTWHSVHHSVPPVRKYNNVRDL